MAAKQNESKKLRILMIGFSPVVRAGLEAILIKDECLEVIGDSPDGYDALLYIKRLHDREQGVNIILTETQNNGTNGVLATRIIKDEFPEIVILVLTDNLNDSYVIDAIHAGASGYIFLKDMTSEELLQSIQRVVEGGTQIKTALIHQAIENLVQNGRKTLAERTTEAAHLTAREIDVLRLMGNGDSNKIISETLSITLDTTKKHVRNVIDKLQARSRTHASIIAAQAGIVGNPLTSIIEAQDETIRNSN